MLAAFIDRGGNFIDTANEYTKGHAEDIIGSYTRHSSTRDRLVIGTKFFGSMYSGDPNSGGASRKAVMSACEQSLRRLKTTYIDIYWMHCWDYHTPVEETLHALATLEQRGDVRYVGFSNTPAWKVSQAVTLGRCKGNVAPIAEQVEYSLLERGIEGEIVPMAKDLGLGLVTWSPLKFGVLSGKHLGTAIDPNRGELVRGQLTDRSRDMALLVRELAEDVGATPAQVAIKWVMTKPGVTSTIVGARTVDQLEENLGSTQVDLSDDHLARLEGLSKPRHAYPYDFVAGSAAFNHSGTVVNGEAAGLHWAAPRHGDVRY